MTQSIAFVVSLWIAFSRALVVARVLPANHLVTGETSTESTNEPPIRLIHVAATVARPPNSHLGSRDINREPVVCWRSHLHPQNYVESPSILRQPNFLLRRAPNNPTKSNKRAREYTLEVIDYIRVTVLILIIIFSSNICVALFSGQSWQSMGKWVGCWLIDGRLQQHYLLGGMKIYLRWYCCLVFIFHLMHVFTA